MTTSRTSGRHAARTTNLLLGSWLFVSGFLWDHGPAERVNTWILGALCAAVAAVAMTAATARRLNTALAVWLFASVWALPHFSVATMWNNAIVALLVFGMSLLPASDGHDASPQSASA